MNLYQRWKYRNTTFVIVQIQDNKVVFEAV